MVAPEAAGSEAPDAIAEWRAMTATRYEFQWDPAKAAANLHKHGVAFRVAMGVFRDPLALSRFDEDNSDDEPRWVTLGEGEDGRLVVVVHAYTEHASGRIVIRMISARRPTKREARQYREGTER
jgi:uncharacterized DUF497 family protein